MSKNLENWITKLKVAYFDGSLSQVNRTQDETYELKSVNSMPSLIGLLVVSRNHYNEVTRTYPVDQNKEVLNLLKLEFEGQHFVHRVASSGNGKSVANVWIFKDTVPEALVTLPETLVLNASANSSTVLEYQSPSSQVFATFVNQIQYSQIRNSLIHSVDDFKMSAGLSLGEVQGVRQIEAGHFVAALMKGLASLEAKAFVRFASVKPVLVSNRTRLFRHLLIPAVATATLYFVGLTGYLFANNYWLENQVEAQNEQIGGLFSLQDALDRSQQDAMSLAEFAGTRVQTAPIWFILAELFQEASFTRIHFSQGRFVLAGRAPKATDILATLNQHPLVSGAKFDSPTRSVRNGEQFLVSFVVNELPKVDAL